MNGSRVVFKDRNTVTLESLQVRDPGPDEVLIKTEVTLISQGTEGANLMTLPNTSQSFPKGAGYSNVGTIESVGEGVENLSPGDRVSSHAPHASFATVRADRVNRVPDGLTSERATFSTLAAIALQGVRKTRVELGESVLVLGQGLVGNLALQLARLQGGFPVIAADLGPIRLKFSTEVGADHVIDALSQNPAEATRALTGDGADVVIEATGAPEPVLEAVQAAGWCGRVVLLASTRGESQNVNFYRDVHKRGITLIGAHNSVRPRSDAVPAFWPLRDDVDLVLRLMAAEKLAVDPLMTTRLPGNEAPEAYRLVTQKKLDALGILLDWREEF